MEVRAHLRYLRVAPRKVRLVINLVRGLPVDQAMTQLDFLPKGSSLPIKKLLASAIANAEHNFKLDRQHLMVKSIVANEGPRLKRYRPRAFGRAAEILKRMTHVTVVLEDREHKPAPVKTKNGSKPEVTAVKPAAVKHAPAQPATVPAKRRQAADPTDQSKKQSAEDATIRRQGTS